MDITEINFNIADRNIFLSAQVDQESIEKVIKLIIEINNEDDTLNKKANLFNFKYVAQPIKIYIDSFGGNVYQCLGLVSVIENSKTPIHTICTGAAMSCGFIILISGHKRFVHKYSTTLYHTVASFSIGKIQELEEDLNETKRLQKIIDKIVLEKTKITKDKLKQVYIEKINWYISSDESLKLGVVDEIL